MSNSNETVTQLRLVRPQPYAKELFANREGEQALLRRKVDEGQHRGSITEPVVLFWGVSGIGKSWLIRSLAEEHRFQPFDAQRMRKGKVAALLDFRLFNIAQWQPSSWIEPMRQIMGTIQSRLADAKEMVSLQKYVCAFQGCAERVSRGQAEASELAERFAAFISALTHDLVPVLLFDSAETIDGEALNWFESHILEPIVRTDAVVVVIAGRREIPRWREFSVRRRLCGSRLSQLQPFSPEQSAEQLCKHGYTHIGSTIYGLAFGHPYAIQVLGKGVTDLTGDHPITSQVIHEKQQEIVRLLEQIKQALFEGVEQELQSVLQVLSTLRKFNIESARYLLSHSLGTEHSERSDIAYLRLFEVLEDTNLMWWDSERRGYVITDVVRRLLSKYLQLCAPDRFKERHEWAKELYLQWMRDYSGDGASFLLETLYHTTSACRAHDGDVAAAAEVSHLLDKTLNKHYFASIDQANTLLQGLRADGDFQDEFIIPSTVREKIEERVQVFLGQLAREQGSSLT